MAARRRPRSTRPARRGSGAAAVAILGAAALCLGGQASAQDDDLLGWSQTAARGILEVCREGAPDAAAVVEHAQVWGWPTFKPYLEHREGYERQAGGESRLEDDAGDQTAAVEVTVQSGRVVAAAPADIRYFRCDIAADQAILPNLDAYFTGLYGPPTARTGKLTVWLTGAAAGATATDDDAAAMARVEGAGVGAEGWRIEISRDMGRDRAKLTEFLNGPPPNSDSE